jgi:hypothetical protein
MGSFGKISLFKRKGRPGAKLACAETVAASSANGLRSLGPRLAIVHQTARKMRAKPAGRMPALHHCVRPNQMTARQSSGDFINLTGKTTGLQYPNILAVSQ